MAKRIILSENKIKTTKILRSFQSIIRIAYNFESITHTHTDAHTHAHNSNEIPTKISAINHLQNTRDVNRLRNFTRLTTGNRRFSDLLNVELLLWWFSCCGCCCCCGGGGGDDDNDDGHSYCCSMFFFFLVVVSFKHLETSCYSPGLFLT